MDINKRRIVIWIVLSEAMLIISTRFGAFLHEFVGHGLMAKIFGGSFDAFSLTLFAGGEAKFSGDFGEIASMCICLGGIIVNLITGFTVLAFIQKRRFSFSLILFGIFLSGISILSQIQYLVLGAYYQYGDPACLVNYPVVIFLAWTTGLFLLAYFSWYLMCFFFRFQDAYFPVSNMINRAIITFLILGIPIFMYTGLYHSSKKSLASVAAIQKARIRIQKEAETIKAKTKSDQSIEDIKKRLSKYPIFPVILIIYLLTTLLAFLQTSRAVKKEYFPPVPLSGFYCLSWVILSGTFLALIAFLW
ncbi:MAG: M50 family metallopeptidase [bacterium]